MKKNPETPLSPGFKQPKKVIKEISEKLTPKPIIEPKPEPIKEPEKDPEPLPLPISALKTQGILHDWWGHGVNYWLKRKGKELLNQDEIVRAKDICDKTEQKIMEMLAPYISQVMYERAGQISPIGQLIVYTLIIINSKPVINITPIKQEPIKEEPKPDVKP